MLRESLHEVRLHLLSKVPARYTNLGPHSLHICCRCNFSSWCPPAVYDFPRSSSGCLSEIILGEIQILLDIKIIMVIAWLVRLCLISCKVYEPVRVLICIHSWLAIDSGTSCIAWQRELLPCTCFKQQITSSNSSSYLYIASAKAINKGRQTNLCNQYTWLELSAVNSTSIYRPTYSSTCTRIVFTPSGRWSVAWHTRIQFRISFYFPGYRGTDIVAKKRKLTLIFNTFKSSIYFIILHICVCTLHREFPVLL